MTLALAFFPFSSREIIPLGMIVICLSLVTGSMGPNAVSSIENGLSGFLNDTAKFFGVSSASNMSDSMNFLAELAVWESLGTSEDNFESTDSFVTTLGIGDSPDYETGVRFLLFNRTNRPNGIEVKPEPDDLKKHLNPNVPTKVFVFGFNNKVDTEAAVIIRNAYLDRGDYNVIIVDWAPLADTPNYIAARSHGVGVANRTAILLNALADSNICAPKDQHIIGHSLGGQIAGIAAGSARTKPGRCTGLDPAGPLYQVATASGRIDPTDADLVDVIHTSAALYGFPGPVGHVDFYPNGGVYAQPGCPEDLDGNCSHGMAVKFFAYSINNPDAFKAHRCQSHSIIRGICPEGTPNATMGEDIQFQATGMYYLEAKIPDTFTF